MTRMVALLIVLGIAGAQAASLTCDLLCAAPAAASHSADGCHSDADADADEAAGLRLTAVPSRCDHGGLGPWLVDVGQRAPRSVIEAAVQSTDGAVTSELSIGSAHSLLWFLLESPPPLGRARITILRI
jgi:hypothetical protein